MLRDSKAFSGFSAGDIPKVKKFYAETLGLDVAESHGVTIARFISQACDSGRTWPSCTSWSSSGVCSSGC